MLVFAINNRKSFEKLDDYREAIFNVKDVEEYPLILVGNKNDLESERKVTTKEGQDMARVFNCPYLEASAKTRENVDECYFELIKEIRRFDSKKKSDTSNTVERKTENNCCVLL